MPPAQLTDEEKAQAQAAAEQTFAANLAISAYTGETVPTLAELTRQEEEKLVDQKLRQAVVKDVTVTDEDIQALLEELAADQRREFDQDPDLYGFSVNEGEEVFYAPSGYRYVKRLLLQVGTAEIARLNADYVRAETALNDARARLEEATQAHDQQAIRMYYEEVTNLEEVTERARKSLNAVLATDWRNADRELALIVEQIANGTDFDSLIAEFGTDTHMPPQGYAVREGFTGLAPELVSLAMSLDTVGAVSQPVLTPEGYSILQYSGDVPTGLAPLNAVPQALVDGLLEQKQQAAFEAQVSQWLAEADIEIDLSVLED